MSPLELHPLKPMAMERDVSRGATRIHAAGPSFGHVSDSKLRGFVWIFISDI